MGTAIGIASYFVASGALSLLFLTLVWMTDRYEREPWWLVLMAAFWGGIPAIVLSCFTEIIVNVPVQMAVGDGAAKVVGAVFIAPPVEEFAKAFAILLVVLLYRHEFDDVLDGMVYGAAVGVGFSFVEDAVYFLGSVADSGIVSGGVVFAFRNVAFVLNHSLFSAVTGIGFGLGRVYHRSLAARLLWPVAGLCVAIALHASHNALAQFQALGLVLALLLHWAGGIGLLVLVPFLWALERRWITALLRSEIADGFIPAQALAALPFSGWRGADPVRGRALTALRADLAELAFHRRSGSEGWAAVPAGELEELRAKVRSCFAPAPSRPSPSR